MDLVITISIYLPRSSFPTLFALAAVILPRSSDPQLQKKAYKLLPRLATSSAGVVALQERSLELQQLLLNTASSASAPARRDRLAAIAVVVSNIPSSSLHFIPSVLSEVVISAKEVNEKARTEAFDLLVLMGKKMAEGGTIAQSQIPHMAPDAQDVDASLAEYFTMVSAGLAGSTPHMISASIIALTRILYEFHAELSDALLLDLISTMDLFLSSNNREIVRSVLGFVKVAIIGLPENIIRPRLPTLIPGLMGWSHEHKTRFRAKVKHIIERLIRRFGYDTVERNCPEADKKLIANIRKTKERNKRKKAGGGDSDDNETAAMTPKRAARKFESEFDRAVYGSGSDGQDVDSENNPESDSDDDAPNGHRGKGRRSKTYIVEDEDEPLDLLGRKALGHISSTKPLRLGKGDGMRARPKAKTDRNGKLIFGGDADGDVAGEVMVLDEPGDGSLEDGINAYVAAIKGRNAVQRGRGGRLKFSNRKGGEEMDVDDEGEAGAKPGKKAAGGERGGKGKEGGGRGGIGRGGAGRRFSGAKGERGGKNQRRGLGVQGSGRVVKRGGRDGGRGRR
jgi:ribosomal RNA-processing protein 12